ncbi:MAG: SDR family oxidoreductase [Anaerolineales bacterium]|nr:SDR family oxidoreductase [Anaerolineales bacterium]
MTKRFSGKVALITGGTRGIGLATARCFLQEGAAVALVARNPERGQSVAKDLGCLFIPADVRVAAACRAAVAETLAAYGRLDVLVNGAGVIYRNRTVEATTEEEWDITLDTNLKGAFLMSKYALPALRQSKGTIVNVASYVGLVGFAGASAYAASKAGLVSLTRTMALDHAAESIRVNCVCPGSVETDMIYEAWDAYGDTEAARRAWEAKHPLGRIGTPEEIARSILFLASEEASFITGAALAIDGGITAG